MTKSNQEKNDATAGATKKKRLTPDELATVSERTEAKIMASSPAPTNIQFPGEEFHAPQTS